MVLVPNIPLGLITTAVQALAGVLLPSATIFLLLLCNDRVVLGPWANPRWLNAIATTVVGAMLVLSAMLTLTTLFRNLPVVATWMTLSGVLVLALAAIAIATGRSDARRVGREVGDTTWTMPPIDSLGRPDVSRARTLGLVVLRCYLVLAIVALVIKAVRVALGA
jgi:hypothetical protein